MAEAYIVAALRTAGGRRNGRLAGVHPADLASQIIDALIARVGADPQVIEDVILGCVTQAGEQSTNIARNAVLASGLPESVPGVSVDRQCGSSQQALHFAAQAVMSGAQDVVIAAGVESMTRVPMGTSQVLPEKAGLGRYKSPRIEARYAGVEFNQFSAAERIALQRGIDKEKLDRYALSSHVKAAKATREGAFTEEIVPISVLSAAGGVEEHRIDEGIRFDATLEAIQAVKLIKPDGRLTAASASQICDGASGALVVSERGLRLLGATPLARVHHMSVVGTDPVLMLEGPIPATERALKRTGLRLDDIDLYEVNEAFASIPLAWAGAVHADPERLNVHGGAIALGHPLGASGTRLMSTLVHALRRRNGRFGLQTMCEGGGLANVTIIERL